MVKNIIILLLFFSKILVSQDSLSKIAYPKLTVHKKSTDYSFTINWPLRNFEDYSSTRIYYEQNLITDEILEKIIQVEPDLMKKQNLNKVYRNINYNKNLNTVFLCSGVPLFVIGSLIAFDGVYGRYGNSEVILRESIAGSTFLTGIICEVVALVFNKKHKSSVHRAVVILNN